MNGERKLIDTNIMVYAYDISDKKRHLAARKILKNIWVKEGLTTLQNLMEFFVVITQKVERPIPVRIAQNIVEDFLASEKWIIIDRNEETFLKAIELTKQFQVPFWDALIAATMLEHNFQEIITENTKDFAKIPGIKTNVPF